MREGNDPRRAGQFIRALPLSTEQLAAARARAGLRAPGAPGPAPVLEQLQAAASERAAPAAPPALTAIAAALRAVVPALRSPGRADNAKLHEADIPERIATPDLGAIRAAADKAIRAGRQAGEPMESVLVRVFGRLVDFTVAGGRGYCRQSLQAVATAAGVCIDTVCRAVRALQRLDLVDVANTIVRRLIGGERRIVRGANLYLLRRPTQAPAEATRDQPAPSWQERALARWGAVLGLRPSRNLKGFTSRPGPAPSGA